MFDDKVSQERLESGCTGNQAKYVDDDADEDDDDDNDDDDDHDNDDDDNFDDDDDAENGTLERI